MQAIIIFIGELLEVITYKQLLIAFFCITLSISLMLFSIPMYLDYLEHKSMRNAVEWAEVHRQIELILPLGTDLNEYLLIQKIEDTEVEELR